MHIASDGSLLHYITFSDFLDDFAFRDLIMGKLDENPDTRVNGYRDDRTHMKDLFEEFRREIQTFLEWRKSRPDDYIRRAPSRVDLTAYCMSLPAQ